MFLLYAMFTWSKLQMGGDEFTDPNGPMYFKGIYHFFYQYNPYGPHWANIVWAHSVSYDLINWIHLDHALNPTHPFDINGCWSGSTTILPGEIPAILYTGSDTENREVQNLAVPKNLSDPFLIEWVKSAHNPIMTPVDGIHPNFFRDPTTAWQGPDKRWRVIVGSQINGHGTAILYTSEDFGEAGTKYVLKASFNHQDHYVMGNYDPETDIYVVETDFMESALQLRYDYGKFYGSKTFLDSEKKRRVLWAWIDEMDSESDRLVKGWTGLQSFPRTVSIGKSGKQLAQWPIEEIEKLHSEEVNIHDIELKGALCLKLWALLLRRVVSLKADVEVSFVLPNFEEVEVIEQNLVDPQLLCSKNQASVKGLVGPFGLLVLASKDLTEQTAIFFRIFRSHSKYVVLMCSDQSRSSLRDEVAKTTYGAFVNVDPASETISLRSLIDHSIVESFGGEGVACITARVYPKLAIDKILTFMHLTMELRVVEEHRGAVGGKEDGSWPVYSVAGVLSVEAGAPIAKNNHSEQPYRTAYHFQPPKNWMNVLLLLTLIHVAVIWHVLFVRKMDGDESADPNGPMYYKGIYHLFYQHNPYGPLWGNMTWAHSISYDLINWVHLDHALNPTDPFDINGCWSGSTTILPGEIPAILYTGVDGQNRQAQNLAVPKNLSDPLLIEWVKSAHNPIMTPVDGIDPNFYRDPTTAWQGPDKRWRVIVGSQMNGHGAAIMYTSEDFINWTRSGSPLHSSNKTEMWECPDFYPVSVKGEGSDKGTKYVLKASFNRQDHYVMGNYDPKTDNYVVDTDFMDRALQLRYDYGKFYASKTFLDSEKKRQVLWGWIEETDSESNDIEKGWSGLQSFPRTVSIGKSGKQLAQWPVKEIEKLRSEEVNIHDTELKGDSVLEVVGLLLRRKNQASVRGLVGPFGLLVLASKDLTEQTAIFFRIFRSPSKYVVLMCSDQSRSSLSDKKKFSENVQFALFLCSDFPSVILCLQIDHSIVESFGGEGITCITTRVYPKLAIDKEAHVYVFNNGTHHVKISRLSAWSMKEAQFLTHRKAPFS
ncbi:hypothetical protein C3L33_22285, partial [Rhododendron williamsianum]